MRVLHISDLHRAGAAETLKAIWGGPAGALRKLPEGEQRFDFIVVSGDLAARARPSEYDELLTFTREVLQGYLRVREDRRRIIFVPGNHDVDWSAQLGDPLVISELLAAPAGAERLERYIRDYRVDPARSGVRQIVSKYGHLEWLKLDGVRSGARFANVQRFLDEFYDGALGPNDRRLDLVHPAEGHDWSAHVFPEEQVAFYGFNSCFLNDRYWTGAAISREAIANATSHAGEHADGFLRVAVWHHGIHSDSYRPDYLNQADLDELIVSGFHVGFHGHTHKAASAQLGWLGDRFVLVSTGSLGANQEQRPDAIGKQFSIVRLYPHQAHVYIYERAGDAAYAEREPVTYSLRSPVERDKRRVSAGVHRRRYHLDRHGISSVRVAIDGLKAPHPVTLAEVGPPVCDARGLPPIVASGFEVRGNPTEDGGLRFTLYPPGFQATDLEWSYEASNFVALTRAELPLYSQVGTRAPDPSVDATVLRAHTVRFPCKALELRFEHDAPIIAEATVEKRVEQRVEHNHALHWERVASEERRVTLEVIDAQTIALSIEAPIVGHRYAIAYRPRDEGCRLDYTGGRIAARLLDRCLGDREHGPLLALQLAESVAVAVGAVFGIEIDDLQWSGLLWDEPRRALVTAFGNFPHRMWGCRYPYGAGIAGHAFRFQRTAAWSRGAPHTKDALVYQQRPQGQTWDPEHDWLVCVPLMGDADKNPIGVIQFEGTAKAKGFGDRLHEFANAALNGEVTSASSWERFQHELGSAVNTGFWQACAATSWLVDYRHYTGRLIEALGLGAVPSPEADTCDGPTSR